MSAYVQSLSDETLTNIGSSAVQGAEEAIAGAVRSAEEGARQAGGSVVQSGVDYITKGVTNIFGGGSTAEPVGRGTTTPPLPVSYTEEKGTATDGLAKWALPAGLGIGAYLWKKSIVWALGAAVAGWWINGQMRKGGN